MALVRLKLFPNKGEVWVNPDHVATVQDGRYTLGQSGTHNSHVVLAGGKGSYQVHGLSGAVAGMLQGAKKK